MFFRNKTTGDFVTKEEICRLYPNTSFPTVLTAEILEKFGYEPIFDGPRPKINEPYETVEIDGAVEINGKWYTNYVVGPVFKEYTDPEGVLHTVEKQYEEYCLKKYNEQAYGARKQRNLFLSQCDWTQLDNSPLGPTEKNSWISYRRLLRDVPSQEKFPWEIDWPEKPI